MNINRALLLSFLLFFSCEKEIEINYRTIDPIYVVEGRLTAEGAEVLITLTRDMDDGSMPVPQYDAVVTVSPTTGPDYDLSPDAHGYYRAPGLKGMAGETYSLTVSVGNRWFTSESYMHGAAEINQPYFQWLKVMGQKILILTFSFEDIPSEENFYCYRIYRNGENYRWNVMTDRGNDGKTIVLDVVCMSEEMAEKNKEEDWDDILYEGDTIVVELQSIDKRAYDYLFSVALSESASTNPIDNFEGGCLGYFAAYSTSRAGTVFSYADIPNP